ncbi:MAG: hypothetical protein ACLP1E_01500 [Acidimicrobiales bacterium]
MASAGSSRRQVPFGGHQLAEYALAAALVVVGVHLGGRPAVVLAVAGAVVGAFTFVSKGPLGALRIIPRRLHVYLDLVLAAGFAVSPLLYLHDLQIIAIVLSEAIAVLLVRMSLTTEIVPRPRASRHPAPAGAANASSSSGSSDAVSAVAATAGRVVGTAVAKARGSDAPRVAVRSLGRATGQARRLARAARETKATRDSSQPVHMPPGSSAPSS